jgi:hypothetical protein
MDRLQQLPVGAAVPLAMLAVAICFAAGALVGALLNRRRR